MKIALDVMGSDLRPIPDVSGAVQAAQEFGITIFLVGDETRINTELAKYSTQGLDLPIIHAPSEIAMTEHVEAVRAKRDASMNVAIRLLKERQADAFVTAGNSGAALAAALFGLGRIKGVERPARRVAGRLLIFEPFRHSSSCVLSVTSAGRSASIAFSFEAKAPNLPGYVLDSVKAPPPS